MIWTQADWNYQIRNRPSFIGEVQEINISPPVGPSSGPILYFDYATGAFVSSGMVVQLIAADVNQWGAVTAGNQSWSGQKMFHPSGSLPPSGYYVAGAGLGLFESDITFQDLADPVFTIPNATISYNGAIRLFQLFLQHSPLNVGTIRLYADNVNLLTPNASGGVGFDSTNLVWYANWQAADFERLGPDPAVSLSPSFTVYNTGVYAGYANLENGSYAQNGHLGITSGAGIGGMTIAGGIITGAGSAPSIPIAGDVTGTLGASTVSNIDGNPVSASSPTSGQVLGWNGSAWVPTAGGGGGGVTIGAPVTGGTPGDWLNVDSHGNVGQGIPSSISQGGGSVSVDGLGNITANPASGAQTLLYGPSSDPAIQLSPGPTLVITCAGYYVAQCNSAGITTLGNIHPTIELYPNLHVQLRGGSGAGLTIDNTGNCYVVPQSGLKFSAFNVSPVLQQTASGITAGWTQNLTGTDVVYNESTWTGNTGSTAYTIGDIVAALKLYGWLVA